MDSVILFQKVYTVLSQTTVKKCLIVFASVFFTFQISCFDDNPVAQDDHYQPQSWKIASQPIESGELEGITIDFNAISSTVNNRLWKLVFCHDDRMYLISSSNQTIWRISQDNEAYDSTPGRPNNPIFSPDGKFIAFTGENSNRDGKVTSFVQEARASSDSIMRYRIAPQEDVAADPHWYIDPLTNEKYIYYLNSYRALKFDSAANAIEGETRVCQFIADTMLSAPYSSSFPGGFKGGISKDFKWVSTSFISAALYEINSKELTILGCQNQYCNPSMNPYVVGSSNTDYMLMLGFGNYTEKDEDICQSFETVDGDFLYEGQHHNLWMFNSDSKIAWRAQRIEGMKKIEKPEWSTHPEYATAVCERTGPDAPDQCDLYIIKIPNLANTDRTTFQESTDSDFVKIGSGGFSVMDWTHLWVEQ